MEWVVVLPSIPMPCGPVITLSKTWVVFHPDAAARSTYAGMCFQSELKVKGNGCVQSLPSVLIINSQSIACRPLQLKQTNLPVVNYANDNVLTCTGTQQTRVTRVINGRGKQKVVAADVYKLKLLLSFILCVGFILFCHHRQSIAHSKLPTHRHHLAPAHHPAAPQKDTAATQWMEQVCSATTLVSIQPDVNP